MKISEFWLRELVNPDIDSKKLIEQMTMFGLEIKSVEPVANQFTGVVIGQIIECYQHSNINNFFITKVDIGSESLLQIISSAHNCRTNLWVVVAKIGAILPNQGKIKATKIYGTLSEGILCSFSELGITGYNHNGIIELPSYTPLGQDIRNYLQLDDNIFNISVTPNRADCLCLLGIARDIAVQNRLPLNIPVFDKVITKIKDILPIRIHEEKACPRYLGRIITNINTNISTPLWMQEKLRRCGISLVNTIVNITNYVMIEMGQPINIFDNERINGGIVVRYATQHELITLLTGRTIPLSSDTLVIADNEKILAIAGIINNSISSINHHTRNILLECAFFNPLAIIGRANYYRLHTNASYRYERGVDPLIQFQAMERVTALILAICGGEPGPVINITSTTYIPLPTNITLQRKTMDCLIGHFIPDEDVKEILVRIGCKISINKIGWQVTVPSWRFDLLIEEDLIEEIMRFYGYDALPHIPIKANLLKPYQSETRVPLSRIKTLLIDRGYQEIITYSFVNPKIQALLHPDQIPLILPQPISQDMSSMRLSLWTGLLETVVYNQNRQQQQIRLFESGLCFIPDKTVNLEIRQDFMLAGVITGLRFNEHWDLPRQIVDFYDAKGDIEAILEVTDKLDKIEFRAQKHPALHIGQQASIYLNQELIGFIGIINPKLKMELNLNNITVVFELFWDKINQRNVPKAYNISRFPATRRDIAIVVPDNVTAADIITVCKNINKNQLININLFDVYRGKELTVGFKSVALSLILQDSTHTLAEEEITAIVAKCVAALKQKFHATLRN